MEEDYYCGSEEEEDDYYSYSDQEDEESDTELALFRAPPCKIITRESLLVAQTEDLQRVMELLSLKEHHARTLLIHYCWDVERLTAVYVERGEPFLFSQAGVIAAELYAPPEPSSTIMCHICMENVAAKDSTKMECEHCFCNNCWTKHFIVKINEGQSKRIRCMAHKCNSICDEDIIRKLVSVQHPDLAEKFERFLLESYIEDNKMVKWCPSVPHCGNAIRVGKDECCEVECSCGMQFCFSCLSEPHSPCSCSMWEMWTNKCVDESETVNWVVVNTKPCPKCRKPVQRIDGCNLMTCICGQTFCWECGLATGKDHTRTIIFNHTCARYKDEKKAERAKRDLDRYMHYHTRSKAHMDSSEEEEYGLREKIKKKVSNLEAEDLLKYRDFSWATNGLDGLLRARRALSYSYPFAYYMFGEELFKDEMTEEGRKIKKELFEDQQKQLESNVVKLSKLLGLPFDDLEDEEIAKIQEQVVSLSAMVDDRCKNMYECIENDLLGSLKYSIHNIAPYRSKGIKKAVEL
ncbi:putative E3 ubiquitin-protein ligase ari2 [Castilleja foliolosa]|uniref:RBR-type E3 ubiquitin transferase n=1 Tax=Castilleja foliolosa TaxID=1961234 RepID=A0ABD3BUN7_9LAMI